MRKIIEDMFVDLKRWGVSLFIYDLIWKFNFKVCEKFHNFKIFFYKHLRESLGKAVYVFYGTGGRLWFHHVSDKHLVIVAGCLALIFVTVLAVIALTIVLTPWSVVIPLLTSYLLLVFVL